MRLINEIGSHELRWVQPSVRQSAYELRAGDEVVAALRWHKACGSLADATTEDRHWTFKRTGFWHPRVTVRVEDARGTPGESAALQEAAAGGMVLKKPGAGKPWVNQFSPEVRSVQIVTCPDGTSENLEPVSP